MHTRRRCFRTCCATSTKGTMCSRTRPCMINISLENVVQVLHAAFCVPVDQRGACVGKFVKLVKHSTQAHQLPAKELSSPLHVTTWPPSWIDFLDWKQRWDTMANAMPRGAFCCPSTQDRLHFDGQSPPILAILHGGRLVPSPRQRSSRLLQLDRCFIQHGRAVPMRCRGSAGKSDSGPIKRCIRRLRQSSYGGHPDKDV